MVDAGGYGIINVRKVFNREDLCCKGLNRTTVLRLMESRASLSCEARSGSCDSNDGVHPPRMSYRANCTPAYFRRKHAASRPMLITTFAAKVTSTRTLTDLISDSSCSSWSYAIFRWLHSSYRSAQSDPSHFKSRSRPRVPDKTLGYRIGPFFTCLPILRPRQQR
jgi:hypothetical protein